MAMKPKTKPSFEELFEELRKRPGGDMVVERLKAFLARDEGL